MFKNFFLTKIIPFMRKCGTRMHGRARQAADDDDDTAHALFMLDN
jgi:hypothetical protein